MVLGAARVVLHVHGSRSLKEKRGVMRSITGRLRNRFNLAVAEVEGQDSWQRGVIGLAAAGADPRTVRGVLERAVAFIGDMHLAEVVDEEIEVLTTPLSDYDDATDGDDEDFGFGADDDGDAGE